MLLGISLILMAFIVAIVEIKASNKRKILEKTREVVYTEPSLNQSLEGKIPKNVGDALALGIGSGGLTILDIYSQVDNHSDVLNVLEQRCPNTLSDMTPIQWFEKVESLEKNNSLGTYTSLFKGQEAENIALDMLRNQGLDAQPFSSLTHADDDIFVTLGDNTEVPYSVKCGSIDYIKNAISAHPDSHDYIINSDVYQMMEESGDLESYANQGITIIDGGYTNGYLTDTGDTALADIGDSGDVSDHVPYIALALFGFKTVKNMDSWINGEQSFGELKVNIAVDAARAGSSGFTAYAGAKAGAFIGSFFPGPGTIIGGVLGTIGGALLGGSLFKWLKEELKWGKIIKAIDYFGCKYEQNLTLGMKNMLGSKFLNLDEVNRKVEEESKLTQQYQKQLNPYSWTKPSVPAVVNKEYLAILNATQERIIASLKRFQKEVEQLCQQYASKMHPNSPSDQLKTKRRLLGDLILANQWILEHDAATTNEIKLISQYNEQIEQAPNHPYRIKNSEQVLKQLLQNCYYETDVVVRNDLPDYGVFLYFLSGILLISGCYAIF